MNMLLSPSLLSGGTRFDGKKITVSQLSSFNEKLIFIIKSNIQIREVYYQRAILLRKYTIKHDNDHEITYSEFVRSAVFFVSFYWFLLLPWDT